MQKTLVLDDGFAIVELRRSNVGQPARGTRQRTVRRRALLTSREMV